GIGDQLEAQPDRPLLPRPAGTGTPRRAVGRGFVMGVAEAAVAALEEDQARAGLGQIGQHRLLVLIEDLGAGRHFDDQGRCHGPMALAALAIAAARGFEMLGVAEVDQGVQPVTDREHDVAAAAAIAAIRTALVDELLAPKRDATAAAVAAAEMNLDL